MVQPSYKMAEVEPTGTGAKLGLTSWAVSGYMVCSSTLLVGNKYAVQRVKAPAFILWSQLFGTTVAVKAAHAVRAIENLDALEWSKVLSFMPVALIFVATIFLNMKSLEC